MAQASRRTAYRATNQVHLDRQLCLRLQRGIPRAEVGPRWQEEGRTRWRRAGEGRSSYLGAGGGRARAASRGGRGRRLRHRQRRGGESVHAVVVTRPGSSLDAVELTRFARAHLAGYKVPRSVRSRPSSPRPAPASSSSEPCASRSGGIAPAASAEGRATPCRTTRSTRPGC